jgi:hypothetical protein
LEDLEVILGTDWDKFDGGGGRQRFGSTGDEDPNSKHSYFFDEDKGTWQPMTGFDKNRLYYDTKLG